MKAEQKDGWGTTGTKSFDRGEDKVEETKECWPASFSRFRAELEATIQFPGKRWGEKERTARKEKPKRIKETWNERTLREGERERHDGLRRTVERQRE